MNVGRFGLGEPLAMVGGGLAIAAVFQPWYSFRLSQEASDALTGATGLDPLSATVFEQGLNAGFASHQPTAWELFDRTDWVLLVIGALAALTALLAVVGVVDRPQPRMLLLGGGAIIAVAYRLAIPPISDPAVEVAVAAWGWVALAGAVTIALSATIPPPSRKAHVLPATASPATPPPVATPSPVAAPQPLGGPQSMSRGFAGGARVAGWYDDPDGSGLLRYWDGRRWTWDTKKKGGAGMTPAAVPPDPA